MKVSYINKVLAGTRTVDLVEFVDIARALSVNPLDMLRLSLD